MPKWPQIQDPLASVAPVLKLQSCVTMHSFQGVVVNGHYVESECFKTTYLYKRACCNRQGQFLGKNKCVSAVTQFAEP